MMSNLPPCPACGEPELWRVIGIDTRAKCAECGWDSGTIAQRDGMTKAELIAAAVREYKVALVESK